MDVSSLFKPFSHKSLNLENRIVMAPMTRNFSPGHVANEAVAEYYKRRVEGGVGLVITEATGVNRPVTVNEPAIPLFHGEAALAGWQRVLDASVAAGGVMIPQLWHIGNVLYRKKWWPEGQIDTPSGITKSGRQTTEPMTEEAIADVIRAFAEAAVTAKSMGFPGIEIHGAHGYLIDQFFWDFTNRRTDRFGGATLLERSRFAAELIKAVRKAVGEDYCIVLRLSQWKQQDYSARLAVTPQELEAWLGLLVDAGVDIFHCSQRRFWTPEFEGSSLNFAGWTKKLTGKPTISVGSVGLSGDVVAAMTDNESSNPASIDGLLERMDKGEFDLIAVGRALIVDPDWANKVKEGRFSELSPYTADALNALI